MSRIQQLIDHLGLLPHPEGGFFRETYRSGGTSEVILPNKELVSRNHSTAIYFLLTRGNFSAFHRIASDEVWHFYEGDPIAVHCLDPDGNYRRLELGNKVAGKQQPQHVVTAGTWFASEVIDGGDYGLVGCTVAPGFDFADFELAKAKELTKDYPVHGALIERLTRQ